MHGSARLLATTPPGHAAMKARARSGSFVTIVRGHESPSRCAIVSWSGFHDARRMFRGSLIQSASDE